MRVSQRFKLPFDPSQLDFIDIDIVEDRKFFVDPHAVRLARTDMSRAATLLVQGFFSNLLEVIRSGDDNRAYRHLRYLLEPNETHFGYSAKFSRGRALGPHSAEDVLSALKKSMAVQTGLLRDLEDAALLIEGIDRDIVSDMATNIIRPILIDYTQRMASLYGIPVQSVKVGAIWDAEKCEWRTDDVAMLPVGPRGALLFVPKLFVRVTFERDRGEYFRKHVAPALEAAEIRAGTDLVQWLKNGQAHVPRKILKNKYGAGKPITIQVTRDHPGLLDDYRKASGERIRRAVSQERIAAVLKAPKPKWKTLAADAVAIPAGEADAANRARTVFAFATALLHPNVTFPILLPQVGKFYIWRFDAISNVDGPLAAVLAQVPSESVDVVVLNDDLTPKVVPQLIQWLKGRDRISVAIVVARSVHKDARTAVAATVPGVLLLGDDDLSSLGDQRASGPESVSEFFIMPD
ncbi:MAG TPA: hypothetical protein VGQ36_23555 [Thermoanaerobaculia bacterium]|jgi:hypothetical protein|nr:hypothetical protein [Thermoanaerobaculia bacterium]